MVIRLFFPCFIIGILLYPAIGRSSHPIISLATGDTAESSSTLRIQIRQSSYGPGWPATIGGTSLHKAPLEPGNMRVLVYDAGFTQIGRWADYVRSTSFSDVELQGIYTRSELLVADLKLCTKCCPEEPGTDGWHVLVIAIEDDLPFAYEFYQPIPFSAHPATPCERVRFALGQLVEQIRRDIPDEMIAGREFLSLAE